MVLSLLVASMWTALVRQVLKASVQEIDEQAGRRPNLLPMITTLPWAEAAHAPVMWNFLIAFAAKKPFFRSLIIQVPLCPCSERGVLRGLTCPVQVFNKLMQVPSWVAAWEADVELHNKVQTLHEAELTWF